MLSLCLNTQYISYTKLLTQNKILTLLTLWTTPVLFQRKSSLVSVQTECKEQPSLYLCIISFSVIYELKYCYFKCFISIKTGKGDSTKLPVSIAIFNFLCNALKITKSWSYSLIFQLRVQTLCSNRTDSHLMKNFLLMWSTRFRIKFIFAHHQPANMSADGSRFSSILKLPFKNQMNRYDTLEAG